MQRNEELNRVNVMESGDHLKNGASLKSHTSKGNKMQKTFLCFAIFCICVASAFAQDVIILKSGEDIQALVQEVGIDDVKYKRFDNQNGPNYTLRKSKIFMIRYANGSKDVFSTESKDVSNSESESLKSNERIETYTETVSLPKNMQNRNDVIVLNGRQVHGFQAKITNIGSKHIFYIKFKKNGKEKDRKINQRVVAYTLSWDESVKYESYPLRMGIQEFTSLPVYHDTNNPWNVFGTNRMSNLVQVRKTHPEIYTEYATGVKLQHTSRILGNFAILFLPLHIPSIIIEGNAYTKMYNAMASYHTNCVNLDVLNKYGIIITPYRRNPLMQQR